MLAVIKTNGFQYVVSEGDTIFIPAIVGKTGNELEFTDVLMLKDDKGIEVGRPLVKGAKVKGVIKKTGKCQKVIVYKFIRRENYRRKKGHRQPFTEVEITEILKE